MPTKEDLVRRIRQAQHASNRHFEDLLQEVESLPEPRAEEVRIIEAPSDDDYITVKEIAKRLKVSEATVWRWRANGTIPSGQKFGSSRRWKVSDLKATEEATL